MLPPRARGPIVFAALFVGAVSLRSAAFFQSGMGDESLYLLVARAWLDGGLPYVDVIDNKPPGIYLLFAAAQLLLGRHVLSIRLLACLAVTASAWVLLRAGGAFRRPGGLSVGLVAAVLYLFHTVGNGGLESNTELFYAPFVIGGFWLVWDRGRRLDVPSVPSLRQALAIGLLFGAALQIKTVVIFDLAAAAVMLTHQVFAACRREGRPPLPALLRTGGAVALGVLAPLALALAYFGAAGHLQEFFAYNVGANLANRNGTPFSLGRFLVVLKEQLVGRPLLWLPLVVAAYLHRRRLLPPRERRFIAYAFLWLAFAFLGVGFTKLFYPHYFHQLLAAQCLVGAVVLGELLQGVPSPRRAAVVALVLAGPLVDLAYLPLARAGKQSFARLVRRQTDAGDTAAAIARYLRPRVGAEQSIYVADYKAVIYYLVPSRLPSRWVLPEFLTTEHFAHVSGADPLRELEAILARAPVYIIRRRELDTPFYQRLDEALRTRYALEQVFEEADSNDWMLSEHPEQDRFIELYRLR